MENDQKSFRFFSQEGLITKRCDNKSFLPKTVLDEHCAHQFSLKWGLLGRFEFSVLLWLMLTGCPLLLAILDVSLVSLGKSHFPNIC